MIRPLVGSGLGSIRPRLGLTLWWKPRRCALASCCCVFC